MTPTRKRGSLLLSTSLLLLPQAAYRIGDHLRIFLGAYVFEGAAASLGGRLSRNDQAVWLMVLLPIWRSSSPVS